MTETSADPPVPTPLLSRVRWLRLVPGLALVAVPLWVAATRWDVLLANHPAYPLTLLVALVAGIVLVVTALTASSPPRPGAWRVVLRVVGAVLGLLLAAVLVWLRPFAATEPALVALESDGAVTVRDSRTSVWFEPTEPAGSTLRFYPGALVDPRAYARLAHEIAARGHRVVVLKCPYDIAFLCPGPGADGAALPGARVVGGHSLGGVVASSAAAEPGAGQGLVLWASYPVSDLSGEPDLAVASISGSLDGLSTPEDIAASADLLPASTVFTEIEGAVHAYFGDYGEQPGDGTATIPREEAQEEIVAATVALLDRLAAQEAAR